MSSDGTAERAKMRPIRYDKRKDRLPEPAHNEAGMFSKEHDEMIFRRAA